MENIKIAVAFHRPAQIDNYIKDGNIYVPIYSGHDWNTNMLRDDSGLNCSDLNKEINQITQLYWFATKLDRFNDPDYIGLHHYRRFLKFDIHDLNPNTIQATCFHFKTYTVLTHISWT